MDIVSRKRKQVERGNLAKDLLENTLLQECFSKSKEYLLNEMENTQDEEKLLSARRELDATKRVETFLKSVASSGKVSEKELLQLTR